MAESRHLEQLMELTGTTQQKRQKVMIIGGGLVGSRLAHLLGKAFDVRLIEKDEETAKALSHELSHTEILHGDGSDSNILVSAGLQDMDTFITATGENETNIMSCVLAKHLMTSKQVSGGKQHKCISLVNKEDYVVLAATMGTDISLNKKILASNEIFKFIRRGELLSVAHLHGFDAEMVEIVAAKGSPITKTPLSKLGKQYSGMILIGGIHRNGTWQVAVGDTRIQSDERVIVVCMSENLRDVQKLFLA